MCTHVKVSQFQANSVQALTSCENSLGISYLVELCLPITGVVQPSVRSHVTNSGIFFSDFENLVLFTSNTHFRSYVTHGAQRVYFMALLTAEFCAYDDDSRISAHALLAGVVVSTFRRVQFSE